MTDGGAPARPVRILLDHDQPLLRTGFRMVLDAEIARALSVSETTIKTHVGHVLTKLGLRDRAPGGGTGLRVRPGPPRGLAR